MERYLIGFAIFLWACGSMSSCGKHPKLEIALENAGYNRVELLKVIDYYQNQDNSDTQKLKAAYFLIENMIDQGSICSGAIDSFRNDVVMSDSMLRKEQVNELWKKQNAKSKIQLKLDLKTLDSKFLIENIDMAFKAWKNAPWKDEVDFGIFCRNVLPYRFDQELVTCGWRDSLYRIYHPLIRQAKTVKDAFEIVYSEIGKRFVSQSSKFPYVIDVVAMQHQSDFSCMQRCILMGDVMRALGIPVAIDNVGFWANYSSNSHSWVALVTKNGTYSIYENENEARMKNRIDATHFELKCKIEEDYPFDTGFQKRCSKIWRRTFERHEKTDTLDNDVRLVKRLSDPYVIDVSREYGLSGTVDIRSTKAVKYVYLCTFMTGNGWIPMCYAKNENGVSHFDCLGDSILYIPMGIIDNKMTSMNNPFILVNNKRKAINPNLSSTRTIVVNRKYPITGRWLKEWNSMIGGCFEASNDENFTKYDVIHTITRTPVFCNRIPVSSTSKYRYIRYLAKSTTPMAEIVVVGKHGKIKLSVSNSTIRHAERAIDNDTNERTNAEIGYISFDMGEPQMITSIMYFPQNDDNFVIPGHEYELFYFDNVWKSLGKKRSKSYSLSFDNVPDDALLLLRDYTKGHEERPFLYKNGRQEWW